MNEAEQIVEALNKLRADEGNMVMLVCPNPDFNGLPDEVVDVSGDWNAHQITRYGGDTLLQALQRAVTAYDAAKVEEFTGEATE